MYGLFANGTVSLSLINSISYVTLKNGKWAGFIGGVTTNTLSFSNSTLGGSVNSVNTIGDEGGGIIAADTC